jgi:hypothetical protein
MFLTSPFIDQATLRLLLVRRKESANLCLTRFFANHEGWRIL